MSKITKKQKEICDTWDKVESGEPDISTERLIITVADKCNVDVSEVADALKTRIKDN